MKTKVQYKLEEDIYNKHTVADIFHPKTKTKTITDLFACGI